MTVEKLQKIFNEILKMYENGEVAETTDYLREIADKIEDEAEKENEY